MVRARWAALVGAALLIVGAVFGARANQPERMPAPRGLPAEVTTTTVAPTTATVVMENYTAGEVDVFVRAGSEHATVLAADGAVRWIVTAAPGEFDAGGAHVVGDPACGVAWADVDHVVPGHRYRMTVLQAKGACPVLRMLDLTTNVKTWIGEPPR